MSEALEGKEFGVILNVTILSMSAPVDKMIIFEHKMFFGCVLLARSQGTSLTNSWAFYFTFSLAFSL